MRKGFTVYRYGDRVAVTPPEGPTKYLAPAEAASLSSALAGVALEIRDGVPFAKSAIGTATIETTGERD